MTTKGKIFFTLLIIAIAAIAFWNWSDKILPTTKQTTTQNNTNPAQTQTGAAKKIATIKEITSKLLAADQDARLVGKTAIPPVTGVSKYKLETKNGKPLVTFPINIWPGFAPLIVANAGLEPNDNSLFTQHGFYLKITIVDDPVKNRDLYASGQTPIMWGTLDMIALFASELAKDTRTIPNIPMQIDFSAGGDGVVARNGIHNINDLRPQNGARRQVVVAQNSPSHFLIMSLLLDARIDPDDIDFKWASDTPAAAKLYVQDKTLDAFVGFSPDIYTVSEMDPTSRLIVSTQSANRRIADVFAIRNDFANDHPEIVQGLVTGILQGIDKVRANPEQAAQQLAQAFNLPIADTRAMIGKDGGIATGDAHLTNYRENINFYLNPTNPANFEIVYNQAAAIYQSLGAINKIIPATQVKYTKALENAKPHFPDSKDLSQPIFKPGMNFKLEADTEQILTQAIVFNFKPNSTELATDPQTQQYINEVGKTAGSFGRTYIVIEGNTDASKRNVVPADEVKKLSYQRAEAVKAAILAKYQFDPDQFKVVGNGWDNPLPGHTNPANPADNAANRRVEVKIYPLEANE